MSILSHSSFIILYLFSFFIGNNKYWSKRQYIQSRISLIWKIRSTHSGKNKKNLKINLKERQVSSHIPSYIQNIIDNVGAPISIKDYIEIVLDGLPEKYNSFIRSITSRLDSYTIDGIETFLLVKEERLEKYKSLTLIISRLYSFMVDLIGALFQKHMKKHKFAETSILQANTISTSHFSRNYNSSCQLYRLLCEICRKEGHVATHCWYRYDQNNAMLCHIEFGLFIFCIFCDCDGHIHLQASVID